jgi:acid-sensing ion channel, other
LYFRVADEFFNQPSITIKFPGTQKYLSPNQYPIRSSFNYGNGLRLAITRNPKVKVFSECLYHSFLVHSPFEYPGSYEKTEMVEFELEILITPEVIRTDEDLKSYEPHERGCYFNDEKKLKYFKVYTRRNCYFECLADYLNINPKLNCTPFFMVRDDSTKVCDYRNGKRVKEQMMIAYQGGKGPKMKCDCLEECDLVKYNIEVTSKNLKPTNDTSSDEYAYSEALLLFKFKDVDVLPLRRYQPFTFSDFLAQSGGMMGLFAGISALSIIELVYFMTMRWMTNLWRWIVDRLRND